MFTIKPCSGQGIWLGPGEIDCSSRPKDPTVVVWAVDGLIVNISHCTDRWSNVSHFLVIPAVAGIRGGSPRAPSLSLTQPYLAGTGDTGICKWALSLTPRSLVITHPAILSWHMRPGSIGARRHTALVYRGSPAWCILLLYFLSDLASPGV